MIVVDAMNVCGCVDSDLDWRWGVFLVGLNKDKGMRVSGNKGGTRGTKGLVVGSHRRGTA